MEHCLYRLARLAAYKYTEVPYRFVNSSISRRDFARRRSRMKIHDIKPRQFSPDSVFPCLAERSPATRTRRAQRQRIWDYQWLSRLRFTPAGAAKAEA